MSLYIDGPPKCWGLAEVCFFVWSTPAPYPVIRGGIGKYRMFLCGHGFGVQLT